MVKHEYNVITGSSYTCDVIERRQLIIKGFKTEKKSKKQKYGKKQRWCSGTETLSTEI